MNKDETVECIDEEDDSTYYCKQCGWKGRASELVADSGYVCGGFYEDYPPYFCPKCWANEYSVTEYFSPDFWDTLKFFFRKISFYGFRHKWGYTHPPLKYQIYHFFKYYIKRYFRLIKVIYECRKRKQL